MAQKRGWAVVGVLVVAVAATIADSPACGCGTTGPSTLPRDPITEATGNESLGACVQRTEVFTFEGLPTDGTATARLEHVTLAGEPGMLYGLAEDDLGATVAFSDELGTDERYPVLELPIDGDGSAVVTVTWTATVDAEVGWTLLVEGTNAVAAGVDNFSADETPVDDLPPECAL